MFGIAFDNFASDPAFCSALGGEYRPLQSRAKDRIKAPALVITGELDDRTPPGNDAVLAKEFATSTRILVPNGGHELLPLPAVQKLVTDFFSGADVRGRTVNDEPRRFMPIEMAKQPPRRRGG